VVVYVFKDMRKTAVQSGQPEPTVRRAWERLESRPPLTGNRTGTNVAISLFNGFNLLAPLWIVPAFEAGLAAPIPGQEFLLHDYPLAFSGLLFAVPLGRWLVERAREPGRRRRNARRRLLQSVLARQGQAASIEELAPEPATAQALSQSLVALGGDVVADDQGQIRYAFPRIGEELAAIEKARAQASGREQDPGAIVFRRRTDRSCARKPRRDRARPDHSLPPGEWPRSRGGRDHDPDGARDHAPAQRAGRGRGCAGSRDHFWVAAGDADQG